MLHWTQMTFLWNPWPRADCRRGFTSYFYQLRSFFRQDENHKNCNGRPIDFNSNWRSSMFARSNAFWKLLYTETNWKPSFIFVKKNLTKNTMLVSVDLPGTNPCWWVSIKGQSIGNDLSHSSVSNSFGTVDILELLQFLTFYKR